MRERMSAGHPLPPSRFTAGAATLTLTALTLEIACGSTPWYFRQRYSPRLNPPSPNDAGRLHAGGPVCRRWPRAIPPSRRPRSRPPPTRSQRGRAVANQALRPTRRRRRIRKSRIQDLAASLQTFASVVSDRRRRPKASRCAGGAQQAWLHPRVFERPRYHLYWRVVPILERPQFRNVNFSTKYGQSNSIILKLSCDWDDCKLGASSRESRGGVSHWRSSASVIEELVLRRSDGSPALSRINSLLISRAPLPKHVSVQ